VGRATDSCDIIEARIAGKNEALFGRRKQLPAAAPNKTKRLREELDFFLVFCPFHSSRFLQQQLGLLDLHGQGSSCFPVPSVSASNRITSRLSSARTEMIRSATVLLHVSARNQSGNAVNLIPKRLVRYQNTQNKSSSPELK